MESADGGTRDTRGTAPAAATVASDTAVVPDTAETVGNATADATADRQFGGVDESSESEELELGVVGNWSI